MRSRSLVGLSFLASAVMVSACESSSGPDRHPVSISFSSQSSAGTLVAGLAAANLDITVTGGGNTLVITGAQLVLRDIKLKPSTAVCAGDDDGAEDDDNCANIHVGPVLVDLPLSDDVVTPITASVPAGTFRRIQLKLHKPGDDDPEDVAFVAANPAFEDISIRVEGTFNGEAFVFTSDANENVELEFSPAIVIDEDNMNFTVQVDVASWFKSGTAVIDPRTANDGEPNENTVKNNIRASLRAIEDKDRNGR